MQKNLKSLYYIRKPSTSFFILHNYHPTPHFCNEKILKITYLVFCWASEDDRAHEAAGTALVNVPINHPGAHLQHHRPQLPNTSVATKTAPEPFIVPPTQWISIKNLQTQPVYLSFAKRFANSHSLLAVLDGDYPVFSEGLQVAEKHEMGRSVGSGWPCNQYRNYLQLGQY